ncbi:MAG: hypothetical protein Q9M91_06825 [Candidatus Dojkabacteria bacterium]|nr:hypothetical protein [Candidatus Dojkabacteria bacterium]
MQDLVRDREIQKKLEMVLKDNRKLTDRLKDLEDITSKLGKNPMKISEKIKEMTDLDDLLKGASVNIKVEVGLIDLGF